MSRRMALRRFLLIALASAALSVAAPGATAAPPAHAAAACPATFQVLHDDRIGSVRLPAGAYRVATTGVSCATASSLLAQFLEDWDGVLPRPWKPSSTRAGQATFRGSGSTRFSVSRAGSSGGGGGGGGGGGDDLSCPTAYTLLHSDRIGALKMPKGRYRITLLARGRLTCTLAAALLNQFTEDFDGKLPGGWVLLPESGTFVRGAISYGFRIKPWTGGGGGGGPHSRTETRCPATFRVLHADRIGPLHYPAGPYRIDVRGVSCARASTLFASFLASPSGNLPRPWRISAATGTFRNGSASLQAKPAFRVR
jgi:hypothetical protein